MAFSQRGQLLTKQGARPSQTFATRAFLGLWISFSWAPCAFSSLTSIRAVYGIGIWCWPKAYIRKKQKYFDIWRGFLSSLGRGCNSKDYSVTVIQASPPWAQSWSGLTLKDTKSINHSNLNLPLLRNLKEDSLPKSKHHLLSAASSHHLLLPHPHSPLSPQTPLSYS